MPVPQPTVSFDHAWNRPYLPVAGADRVYLLVEAEGAARPRTVARAPLNLSLVLDRSGSMSGAPLDYCKEAIRFVLDRLGGDDTVSIVAFDDEVRTVAPPTKVTDLERDALKRLVAGIESGGCTNLSGGLAQGAKLAAGAKRLGTISRVILLSDGHANRGVTTRQRLASMAAEYRSGGVGITALGVGDGFDEELMEAIAEQGGGNFHYIRTPEGIPAIFREELGGLLAVSAQALTLTVRPSEGVTVARAFGYPSEGGPGGQIVRLGDLFQGERKSVLLELRVASHAEGPQPLLALEWAYTDVTEGAAHRTHATDVYGAFSADPAKLDLPDREDVRRQIELTQAAEAIEQAMAAMDDGDLQAGHSMLKAQADHLLRMSAELAEPALAVEARLLSAELADFAYTGSARKALHERKHRYNKRKL